MPIKVLVVEDNAGDARLIQELTNKSAVPVKIAIASSGEEAIAKLDDPKFTPDLIILELNMPKFSGVSLIERLGRNDVPVVIFTSSCDTAEYERALSGGARECFQKPFDLDAFAETLQFMISKWSVMVKP